MSADIQFISVFGKQNLNLHGNVSAVVWLNNPLSKAAMQAIGSDLNQPATTFLWEENNKINVRWFAPDGEIGLCGHGSLAAMAYLSQNKNTNSDITLNYAGGEIKGNAIDEHQCQMQISGIMVENELPIPKLLQEALGVPIIGYFKTSNKNIVLLENEESVKKMKPNFALLRESQTFGYSVTAVGMEVDFVSRTLVPHVQQLEDHATGSSHAALVPFWSHRLNKTQLKAIQHSPRGGYFECNYKDEKVNLKGEYRIIVNGKINI